MTKTMMGKLLSTNFFENWYEFLELSIICNKRSVFETLDYMLETLDYMLETLNYMLETLDYMLEKLNYMLETLDYIIRIDSTPTFLYFDYYL